MGILGDQTTYNALNANKTFTDKVKNLCLQLSNSVLLLKKGNPLVSTPAALAVRFIIIMTSKCLKQHVLDNFIITRRVYPFLSSGRREEKGQQLVKTIFIGRVLGDKFYNKKNRETIVNQFLHYYKNTVLKYFRFFAWAISGTLIENGVIDIYQFIISGLVNLDWATA